MLCVLLAWSAAGCRAIGARRQRGRVLNPRPTAPPARLWEARSPRTWRDPGPCVSPRRLLLPAQWVRHCVCARARPPARRSGGCAPQSAQGAQRRRRCGRAPARALRPRRPVPAPAAEGGSKPGARPFATPSSAQGGRDREKSSGRRRSGIAPPQRPRPRPPAPPHPGHRPAAVPSGRANSPQPHPRRAQPASPSPTPHTHRSGFELPVWLRRPARCRVPSPQTPSRLSCQGFGAFTVSVLTR
jgi:hypothetical protein